MAVSIFQPKSGRIINLRTGIRPDGTNLTATSINLTGRPISTLSFVKATTKTKDKVAFFKYVGEMYHLRTQEIQEELIDLAHVDYPSYVELKRAFRENISLEVQKLMFESVQRFRQAGYTDEQAIEMSKPAADALYKQLKLRFDTLFPKSGDITKIVEEHL